MDKIIVGIIVLLSIFAIKLFITNKKIKQMHDQKMLLLKNIFKSLSTKQVLLNHKASISSEFHLNYKSEIKKLSEEIVELQKTMFDLLTKK